jgi:hypothetical protein
MKLPWIFTELTGWMTWMLALAKRGSVVSRQDKNGGASQNGHGSTGQHLAFPK